MFSSERWCAAPSLTAPAAARGGDIEIIDKEILYRLTVDNDIHNMYLCARHTFQTTEEDTSN